MRWIDKKRVKTGESTHVTIPSSGLDRVQGT